MMSGIPSRNNRLEVALRKSLWAQGYRYELPRQRGHRGLPGIPDLVFPKYRAVILFNGCFFHGHDCHLFVWPRTNPEKWRTKIEVNRERDRQFSARRRQLGWKTLTVWECALRGPKAMPLTHVARVAGDWLRFDGQDADIVG
jgi:DNA mismatch endonuclease, patch repair protein